MKGVPVKRMTLPRIPAPPGVTRGHRTRPTTTPTRSQPRTTRELRRLSDPEEHTMTTYQPGPEDLYPMLRADNAEVLIHPSDRKYGALLIGGQGTGKTSALLAFFINDVRIPTRRRS